MVSLTKGIEIFVIGGKKGLLRVLNKIPGPIPELK
jgi:hypothetical protein